MLQRENWSQVPATLANQVSIEKLFSTQTQAKDPIRIPQLVSLSKTQTFRVISSFWIDDIVHVELFFLKVANVT